MWLQRDGCFDLGLGGSSLLVKPQIPMKSLRPLDGIDAKVDA